MAPKAGTGHPDEVVLLALVDDVASANTGVAEHVADCVQCTKRIADLQAMRRLLHDAANYQEHPQHDVAQRAVVRLRLRQKAVGNVNEIFAAVRALIRGLADMLGGSPAPAKPKSPPVEHES